MCPGPAQGEMKWDSVKDEEEKSHESVQSWSKRIFFKHATAVRLRFKY